MTIGEFFYVQLTGFDVIVLQYRGGLLSTENQV